MLGLLLLYFIGKYFYDLAGSYGKPKWGYAILGIISYYAGTFIGGLVIGFVYVQTSDPMAIDGIPDLALGLLVLPFGLAACWVLYTLLKRHWDKERTNRGGGTLDEEFTL